MHHTGNLTLTTENAAYCEKLTSIGGYLYISRENASLPALTSIGGYPIRTPDECLANLRAVAKLALAEPDRLAMESWHTCETSHCIAGWAAHSIPGGREIERKTNTAIAGAVLLGVEAAKHFLVTNDKACKFLQQFL